MRTRIFEIVEVSKNGDKISTIYDFMMLFSIVVSIIPLMFKNAPGFFNLTDEITAGIFIIDYLLRLITADLKIKKGFISFFRYPFTIWAIIDLISILPSFTSLNAGYKLLRLFRIFKTFRIFRVFKALRYSKSLIIILQVIDNSRTPLFAVCTLAIGYIFISALVIFNIEPDSFRTFFDAIYWATVSLTTVGYGDIYPVTFAGRIITMLSSIFGIAIVALPAGIITAGYMDVINKS